MFRHLVAQRHRELVRDQLRDDQRETREAWDLVEKANPSGYRQTPVAKQILREQRRITDVFYGRDRECQHCSTRADMRRGQKYCSTRCRVAAHRALKRSLARREQA
jgi:hypothetical protein